MVKLKIDPEFRDKIPALTEAEFEQLRENILSDGEVYEPIVTWNDTIVDGHNRWRIICENWEKLKDKFRTKPMDFSDKWEAFEWMYKKQLEGRTPRTDEIMGAELGINHATVSRSYKMLGGEAFLDMMTAIKDAWYSDPDAVSRQIISGVAAFYKAYYGNFKRDDFVSSMRKVSPVEIIRNGKSHSARPNTYAREIVVAYNKKRRNRLDENKL